MVTITSNSNMVKHGAWHLNVQGSTELTDIALIFRTSRGQLAERPFIILTRPTENESAPTPENSPHSTTRIDEAKTEEKTRAFRKRLDKAGVTVDPKEIGIARVSLPDTSQLSTVLELCGFSRDDIDTVERSLREGTEKIREAYDKKTPRRDGEHLR